MAPPDGLLLALAGVFGAMLGSFLNVVIYRLPAGKSIVWPGSHCPACGAPIRWFDNVPLLSWAILRGRCRSCRAGIPVRYPLVEALTAGVVIAIAARYLTGPGGRDFGMFGVATLFTGALLAAGFIDLAHQILPDRITKPGMVAAPVLSLLVPHLHAYCPLRAALADLSPGAASLLVSVAGIVAGAGAIWLIRTLGSLAFRREAMGFGDVKFMGMIGGFTGPVGALLAIVIACFLGAVIGGFSWLVTRRRDIPFGPFLAAGAFALLFFRPEIVHLFTVTWPSLFR